MTYKELSEFIKSKKILLKDVLNEIGYSRQGIEPAIDKETIELRKLKKLCEVVRISPSQFFDSGSYGLTITNGNVQNGNGNKIVLETKEKEIELLRQRLADKDEIIIMLREKIDMINNAPMVAASQKTGYKLKK